MEGNIIRAEDKLCRDCHTHYDKIIARDEKAVVLVCSCGKEWTVYLESTAR